uniref:Uncharacterized protein LOC8266481 n=1 Tax=Rhizophora mucronata TaxID=61149 RepID=A0A2P2NZU9_RHIMU
MKILRAQTKKRIQFLKWGRRIASTESAGNPTSSKEGVPSGSFHGSYVLRRLLWKLRTCWKQNSCWQRSNIQYSYDIYSYYLNFDEGLSHMAISRQNVLDDCIH